MIDLHTHSFCSDGQHSPEELVRLAKAQGITHLALTDHDTTAGLQAAQAAANEAGIRFLCGIEISTNVKNQHLLGYGIDIQSAAMLAACEGFTARRNRRTKRILDVLAEHDVDLCESEVRAFARGQLGRPHFAAALIAKGYVQSVKEAFAKYLDDPKIHATLVENPTAEAAIALVHAAGGKAVWAHPYQTGLKGDALTERLDAMRTAGLDGVEVYYRTHDADEQDFLRRYAEKYGMLMTGGSDYHGETVKPDVTLGVPMRDEMLAMF